MKQRLPRRAFAAVLFGLVVVHADGGLAHIVYGRPTLLSLTTGAELVARVRVVDPTASAGSAGARRSVVKTELREVLKGSRPSGSTLVFAPHGHGVAEYQAGEEAIVFLVPIDKSRELGALEAAGVRWVSFQEHDARYVLEDGNRDRLLRAVRSYVAASEAASPADRLRQLRAITARLILSGDARLAAGAVQDFAVVPGLPLLATEDVPVLVEKVVRSEEAPVSVRTALLTELGRRKMVDAAPLWVGLMRTTPKPDRQQVVRAAGRHPAPTVDAALLELLAGSDAELAEAAALALATPGHAGTIEPLGRAALRPEPRVRRAAIRALGSVGSEAALAELRSLAASHTDPDLRRRANAEVLKRKGSSATGVAP